jgi:hypothetical protein
MFDTNTTRGKCKISENKTNLSNIKNKWYSIAVFQDSKKRVLPTHPTHSFDLQPHQDLSPYEECSENNNNFLTHEVVFQAT